MSRVNPNEDVRTVNPAKRFYSWVGLNGNFEYYDKEKKEKIEVPLPFTFLPISRAITLKGYNDDTKTSYWSNEVKDINTDKFKVQSVNGTGTTKVIRTVAFGLYKDIKPTLDALKISYIESLYIGVKNASKGLDLCNFQIKGSAIKSWFEFCTDNKVWSIAVQVKGVTDKKKGSVKYKEPIYTAISKITKEMNDEAIELNKELDVYLDEYFAKNSSEFASSATASEEVKSPKATSKSEDKPFDNSKHKDAQHVETTIEDDSEDISFGDQDAPDEF